MRVPPSSDSNIKTENLADRLTNLVESYYQLGMVHVTDKTSSMLSVGITGFLMISLFMFVMLFLGLSLGWYVGDRLGSRVGGFLVAAAVYLIGMVAIVVLRKRLFIPRIKDLIIRKMYEQQD